MSPRISKVVERYSLNHQRIAMLRDQRSRLSGCSKVCRSVEVANWNRAVLERCRGEERVGVPMFGDELLRGHPKDLSPNFTNGMNAPVARLIESLIGGGVDAFILR